MDMTENKETRRFGYYIPKPDGTMDISVHSVVADTETLKELNEIVRVVFDLQPIVFAFEAVNENFNEVDHTIENSVLHINNQTSTVLAPVPIVMDAMMQYHKKFPIFYHQLALFWHTPINSSKRYTAKARMNGALGIVNEKIYTEVPSPIAFYMNSETSPNTEISPFLL